MSPNSRIRQRLCGPSYSLEIIGRPGCYLPLTVTDLQMDAAYDCKRVSTPTKMSAAQVAEFEHIAIAIAEALQLKGLMDVEVIINGNRLNVLEIDARLPSQTPTAVYWSTGLNMVALLAELFLQPPPAIDKPPTKGRAVIYEHIHVTPGRMKVCGEHIMAAAGPLTVQNGFFGAEEAITDYVPGRRQWVATLIFAAGDRRAARWLRNKWFKQVCRECSIPAWKLEKYNATRFRRHYGSALLDEDETSRP